MEVVRHQLADDILILQGHVIDGLRTIPDKSVQCVVTSDPYWGLRSYGTDAWEGGDPDCDHAARDWDGPKQTGAARSGHASKSDRLDRDTCAKCGARRIDTQAVEWPEVTYTPMPGAAPITVPPWKGPYGLEPTPEMYVAHSVLIRRELWRVLRDDGTHWLNLGDSYNGSGGAGGDYGPGGLKEGQPKYPGRRVDGLKPKDLVGIPWRVAFALQADGWYLRMDNIWHKPNPMPESVTDRPTKAHEYVFLWVKSPSYFYDADAIREPLVKGLAGSTFTEGKTGVNGLGRVSQKPREDNPAGRNKRSVWTITTKPYPEAHFATFPQELPELCILAGTSPQSCPKCGTPWERVVDKERSFESGSGKAGHMPVGKNGENMQGGGETLDIRRGPVLHTTTVGWQPTCSCEGNDGSGKCIVLDPFSGSGTTGRVAVQHGRAYIGCELNPEYVEMTRRRIRGGQIQFAL